MGEILIILGIGALVLLIEVSTLRKDLDDKK